MARVLTAMPVAGPSSVLLVLVYLLQLIFGCVLRPHRRGCVHARFRWEDRFGGAAVQTPAACNYHQREESNTGGRRKTFLLFHPALSSGDCHRLHGFKRWLRSTATFSTADPWTSARWRDAGGGGIQQAPREGWGDNFHGGMEIIGTPPYTYVEESTASGRRRATANGHRTTSQRPVAREVELYNSTYRDYRYRLPFNDHLSMSDKTVLKFFLNLVRREHERDCPKRFSVDYGSLLGEYWGQRSLLFSIVELDLIREEFSEHWSRRVWQDYSSEEILVQEDDDSHDWREESCIDSTDVASELHDGSCLDQNCVCSDTDADGAEVVDADTNTNTDSQTLHGTVTTSTALVNSVLPRSADSDFSSPTHLGVSSDEASSWTTQQPAGGIVDDMYDCDEHSSITTEELSDGEEMEVSMPQEQTSQTQGESLFQGTSQTTNRSDRTSGTPSWSTAGFRFLPSDKDIVLYYLKPKVLNRRLPAHHMVEERHNIHALDADEITLDVDNGEEERLGFFFVDKHDAYNNGCYYRTPDGYWRIRGRPAGVSHHGRTVAFKTAMDFHRGRPPHGCRTEWSMFEYKLNECQVDLLNLAQPWMNSYVMCKVRWRQSKEQRWPRRGVWPTCPPPRKVPRRRSIIPPKRISYGA